MPDSGAWWLDSLIKKKFFNHFSLENLRCSILLKCFQWLGNFVSAIEISANFALQKTFAVHNYGKCWLLQLFDTFVQVDGSGKYSNGKLAGCCVGKHVENGVKELIFCCCSVISTFSVPLEL